ncbi:MAG: PEP-CTERM sorting domain-containing protein [Terriglobales bacterium]
MRHTRLFAFIFSLLTALLLSGSAFADSMVFNGPGGANLGGVYTYPYNFTVNGTPMQLMCDTFDNEIHNGETWNANESTISGAIASGLCSGVSQAGLKYDAAGIIFDAMLGVNGVTLTGFTNNQDANWAVWALFSGTALQDITGSASSPFGTGGDSGALAIYNNALLAAASAPASDFNGITIYTPVAGSQIPSNDGVPQEFIGYTPVPEPSELSLLGVLALFAVTGFAFRKRFAFERA